MKGVIDNIDVRAIGYSDQWELLEPFDWYGITVPAGFITDFASIPRAFRGWINPVGRIKPAALIHDYLYSVNGKYKEITYTRKAIDQIFLAIMQRVGMGWFKRNVAYCAVRMFGWIYWDKNGMV